MPENVARPMPATCGSVFPLLCSCVWKQKHLYNQCTSIAESNSQLRDNKRVHGLDYLICRSNHLLNDGLCRFDVFDGSGALACQKDSPLVLLQRAQSDVALDLILSAHFRQIER